MGIYRGVKLKLNSEPIRFKSKQNTVVLRDGVVEKHFATADAATFEARELRRLKAAVCGYLRFTCLTGLF